MPSEEQAAMGPQAGSAEGDLQQAWKILSMRLPRVLGALAPASRNLLTGGGMGGMTPAILRALAESSMRPPMPAITPGFLPGPSRGPLPQPPSVPQAPKPHVDYMPRPGQIMGDVDTPYGQQRPRIGGGFAKRGF